MPPFWVKLPLTLSVPIELPGASVASLATMPPIVPLPPSRPPLLERHALARLPFTDSVLALTVVAAV